MNPPRTLATLLVGSLLAVITPPAPAAAPATRPFFPIMAWDAVRDDPAVLKRMHDCGLTVVGFATVSQLPHVRAAGLKAIVSDPRVGGYDWAHVDPAVARKNVESLMKETKDNPTVFGYYLRDEPPASYFPGLATVASLVKELHPGTWPYINLFPNYANGEQLAARDYQDYLDQFTNTCKPPILSYDNYFLTDGGDNTTLYFANLQAMRDQAIKTKVPFWNIVLANAHFGHAEPTRASLLLEVYTSLAYGAKGLAYFTYFAPKVGNYRAAPVDQFDHETPTWALLQNANLQVLQLAPTLLQLTSTHVYHFGGKSLPTPPADSLVVSAGSDQFMAGDFTHADGSQYVMVVNKSLTAPAPVGLQLRTPAKQVLLISPYTGDPTPFEGEQVWLAPGAGALLKLVR